MRAIYWDCFAGIHNNMAVGALLDAGMPIEYLRTELDKLQFASYHIMDNEVVKCGIKARSFHVESKRDGQSLRTLQDIHNIIDKSELAKPTKVKAKQIFDRLATAEANVHGIQAEKLRFNEVGTDDSIINIIAVLTGLDYLAIDHVFSSELHVGSGFVRCSHGLMPVPTPATAELLKNIPFYANEIKGELVTPTGAAVLSFFSRKYGPIPKGFTVEKVVYGAGNLELDIPHVVRMYAGALDIADSASVKRAKIIETNIDDMNPQLYGYIMEKLLEQGVADVYLTSVIMKKGRPGTKMTVMVSEDQISEIAGTILKETTSLGVRIIDCDGFHLEREVITVNTPWGDVKVKLGKIDGRTVNLAPEFEDCKRIAQNKHVSMKTIYQYIMGTCKEYFIL